MGLTASLIASATVFGSASVAYAESFTFDLVPNTADGSSGSGSFDTINPVGPNQFFNGPSTNFFNAFSFTLNNLAGFVSTAIFNISDIPNALLVTDGSGNFTDLNIFNSNNGDYFASGVGDFRVDLLDINNGNATVNDYQITNIQPAAPATTPEPTSVVALIGVGVFGVASKGLA